MRYFQGKYVISYRNWNEIVQRRGEASLNCWVIVDFLLCRQKAKKFKYSAISWRYME